MAVVFNGQNNTNNQQNQEVTPSGFAQPSTGAAPSQGASPAVNSMNSAQKGNAGRFTNLKSYINANQGADTKYEQRLGSNLNQNFNQQQETANTNADAVRQGIQSSQQNLAGGQQLNQQLTGNNAVQNALGFNQNQQNQVAQNMSGYAVDQDMLNQQQQNAMQAQANAQNLANQNIQNLSSEQGRSNLIQQNLAKGNTGYNLGQKRLDNLFLQAGGNNAVSNLLTGARGNLDTTNQLGQTLTGYGTDLNKAITDEQALMNSLKQNTAGVQNEYIQGIESQLPGINTQRANEAKQAQDFYNALKGQFSTPAAGGSVSTMPVNGLDQFSQADKDKYLNMIGLKSGDRVYDVLNKYNNPNELFNINNTQAKNYQDIASQQNVTDYSKLFNLGGTQASYDPTSDQYSYTGPDAAGSKLTQAGNLGAVVSGNANLANDIATRQQEFNKAATAKNVNSSFYNGQSNNANAQNLFDYLTRNNLDNANTSINDIFKGDARTGLNRTGSVDGFDTYRDNVLGGTYRSGTAGAQKEATGYTQWHREKAYNDLMNYLKGQGAFNKV